VLAFSQGIVDATGNIGVAQDAMGAVAMAAQVTGADLQGLGTLVSDAFLKFGISGKDAASTLEILIEQGEKGRYTLNEMAQTGARAMSVAGLAGMKGVEGMREMGAMMQIIRQGFGSAEEAATGFKVMVTKIYSSESKKKLQALGVALRDPDTGKLRDFGDVFIDILRASKGDAMMLSDLFGTRGIMGVQNFRDIMEKSGGSVEAVSMELDKYRGVTGSARTLQAKFNRATDNAATGMEKLKAAANIMVNEVFSPDTMKTLGGGLSNMAESVRILSEALGEIKGHIKGVAGMVDKDAIIKHGGTILNWITGGAGGALVSTIQQTEGRQVSTAAGTRALTPAEASAKAAAMGAATSGGRAKLNKDSDAMWQWYYQKFFPRAAGKGTHRDKAWSRFQSNLESPEKQQHMVAEYAKHLSSSGQAFGARSLLESSEGSKLEPGPKGLLVEVNVHGAEGGADVKVSDKDGKMKPKPGAKLD